MWTLICLSSVSQRALMLVCLTLMNNYISSALLQAYNLSYNPLDARLTDNLSYNPLDIRSADNPRYNPLGIRLIDSLNYNPSRFHQADNWTGTPLKHYSVDNPMTDCSTACWYP